jgi:acetylornithine deacetylase/succinyl-diaminopimelate desuccinylase-like protein
MRDGLERLRSDAPLLAAFLAEPMLSVTLSPTKAQAGEKANVIPSRAEALIDTRVPPGLGEEDARERIAALLGDGDHELEFSESVPGTRSELETPLAAAIRSWIAEADPGAELAPIVMPGFSDSHWFRRAFDSAVVYGFWPHREMPLEQVAPLIHGADERVAVADLELGARFFYELPQRILT